MEKTSFNSLPVFVFQFFVQILFKWVMMSQRLLSSSRSFLQSRAEFFLLPRSEEVAAHRDIPVMTSNSPQKMRCESNGVIISRDDVETVMERLGIFLNPGEESFDHEVSEMFERKEPTADEVEAAFCVFDENRDGFIDATELQRVLSLLGLKEGSELEDCKKMITSFDQNGDGRIDFPEFVNFMEMNL